MGARRAGRPHRGLGARRAHAILRGAVDWLARKDAAAGAVCDVTGVRSLTNELVVRPRVTARDVRNRIEAAFRRSADAEARRIGVRVDGHKVTLTGTVRSWAEREAAERAAWAAPGIALVEDRITVIP